MVLKHVHVLILEVGELLSKYWNYIGVLVDTPWYYLSVSYPHIDAAAGLATDAGAGGTAGAGSTTRAFFAGVTAAGSAEAGRPRFSAAFGGRPGPGGGGGGFGGGEKKEVSSSWQRTLPPRRAKACCSQASPRAKRQSLV